MLPDSTLETTRNHGTGNHGTGDWDRGLGNRGQGNRGQGTGGLGNAQTGGLGNAQTDYNLFPVNVFMILMRIIVNEALSLFPVNSINPIITSTQFYQK